MSPTAAVLADSTFYYSMNYEPQRVFDLHRPQMRVMFVSMQTTFASEIIVAAFDDLAVTRSKRKFTIIFKR